jgi:transmembrane sensor
MNSSSGDERTEARRLVEASAWRTHLSENDLESTPEFEAWLSDGGNRQAWDRVQQGWDLFGEHATSPELLDLRRRALGTARSMGRQRWATRHPWIGRFHRATIAAGILVLAAGGAITFNLLSSDVYKTAAGERRVVTLADGSRVQLDSLTELHVHYSENARDLKLIKGQARFDVARDVQRPFSVAAAGRKVIATGTSFNVDLLSRNLYVTLIEGKVVILSQSATVPRAPGVQVPARPEAAATSDVVLANVAQPPQVVELEAGQQFALSESGEASVAPANVQQATAWQSGQIVVENEPLSSVIMRVNRYAAQPISVTDEKIAALRISGVFNTGDIAGFISTVTHYLPIKAEQSGDVIHLSSTVPGAGASDPSDGRVIKQGP